MTVAAVSRCLTLLEVLAGEAGSIELSDLAGRLDMPASAVHRLLTTLISHGWVTQDAASQNYALSLRLSALAFRNLDARNVPDVVQSVLNRLAAETQEYCRLAILEGQDLVWVARAQGATTGLRYDPDMGQEIVLHATANGKAWLSTLPEERALEIVYSRGFTAKRKLGPNSARSIDELRVRLNETRERGFATSVEEGEAGTAAVAVPFRTSSDAEAPVAGTISVAGPLMRITEDRWPDLVRSLKKAAEELSDIWPLRVRQRTMTPLIVATGAVR
ncbi:IclR family transcriptional regulator (plasmid) [Rhizobium leguminosarum]|uniref:Bacterial transcriptional regulator family protein n=1 Tax=Rhizobium leguminosarum TaxID=384 RepID=A0A2Z4YP56_RHILE|nr:IclR family transcriptional regulator [Rhizobium leguminosarum]AXA43154.1 Bacterial transcriptional regulator family protein [Rhizobium leguminosarum]MBY5463926.1 IclR family transcriptional regulator [Rhizobium leguminosarum]